MAEGFYFILFLMCIFCSLFFLFVAMQRERTDRRKRNMLYYGNASHCFIQNDAVKNRVFHLSASLSCYRTRSAFFLANSLPLQGRLFFQVSPFFFLYIIFQNRLSLFISAKDYQEVINHFCFICITQINNIMLV